MPVCHWSSGRFFCYKLGSSSASLAEKHGPFVQRQCGKLKYYLKRRAKHHKGFKKTDNNSSKRLEYVYLVKSSRVSILKVPMQQVPGLQFTIGTNVCSWEGSGMQNGSEGHSDELVIKIKEAFLRTKMQSTIYYYTQQIFTEYTQWLGTVLWPGDILQWKN